jgi:hypothetical protein
MALARDISQPMPSPMIRMVFLVIEENQERMNFGVGL